MDKTFIDNFIKVWTDRMDNLFNTHVGKNVAPYNVTNTSDILALGLGMGFAEMKEKDGDLIVACKYPVSVRWNGEKFEVTSGEESLSR